MAEKKKRKTKTSEAESKKQNTEVVQDSPENKTTEKSVIIDDNPQTIPNRDQSKMIDLTSDSKPDESARRIKPEDIPDSEYEKILKEFALEETTASTETEEKEASETAFESASDEDISKNTPDTLISDEMQMSSDAGETGEQLNADNPSETILQTDTAEVNSIQPAEQQTVTAVGEQDTTADNSDALKEETQEKTETQTSDNTEEDKDNDVPDKLKSEEKQGDKQKSKTKTLLELFRSRIFLLAMVSFTVTIGLFIYIQIAMARKNAFEVLSLNLDDVKAKIEEECNSKMQSTIFDVKYYIDNREKSFGKEFIIALSKQYEGKTDDSVFLMFLADKFDVTDVLIVGNDGLVKSSSDENLTGFDMDSGNQSKPFLDLLETDGTYMLIQSYQPMAIDNTQWRKFAGVKLKDGGFVQISYGPDKFHSEMDENVRKITGNRRIGETGYLVVFDENGLVVSGPVEDLNGSSITKIGSSIEKLNTFTDGQSREIEVRGTQTDVMGSRIEGYYVLAFLPSSEDQANRRSNTIIAAGLVSITFLAVFLMVFELIKGTILDNLKKISDGLHDIANGDLDVVLDVQGNAEFESLSESINTTVSALRDYKDAEAMRIEEELEYAKSIQHGMLPSVFPPYPNKTEFEIYATMSPAKEVGGDFFDFSLTNDRYLRFCVADVSGKGIPAALFMMRAKTLIKGYGEAGMDVEEIMSRVNDELCSNNEAGMFVTCWLGIMDISTGTIEYANAGHNLPVIIKKNGEVSFLQNKPNFVLAGVSGVKYTRYTTRLEPGETIFVYSDGVTEATNSAKELFGEDRLLTSLELLANQSCEAQCKMLREHIDLFVGDAPQFDDITMLSLLYKGCEDMLTVDANLDNYDQIMDYVDNKLREFGCPPKEVLKINVACDEIIANITSYSYKDKTGPMSVSLEKQDKPRAVVITFTDSGVPFNPMEREDPNVNKSAEERSIGGLGIYMVKNTMDKVEYEYKNSSNILKITKYF